MTRGLFCSHDNKDGYVHKCQERAITGRTCHQWYFDSFIPSGEFVSSQMSKQQFALTCIHCHIFRLRIKLCYFVLKCYRVASTILLGVQNVLNERFKTMNTRNAVKALQERPCYFEYHKSVPVAFCVIICYHNYSLGICNIMHVKAQGWILQSMQEVFTEAEGILRHFSLQKTSEWSQQKFLYKMLMETSEKKGKSGETFTLPTEAGSMCVCACVEGIAQATHNLWCFCPNLPPKYLWLS